MKSLVLVLKKIVSDRKLESPFAVVVSYHSDSSGREPDVSLVRAKSGAKLFSGIPGAFAAVHVALVSGGIGLTKAKTVLANHRHVVQKTALGLILSAERKPEHAGQAGSLAKDVATQVANLLGGYVSHRASVGLDAQNDYQIGETWTKGSADHSLSFACEEKRSSKKTTKKKAAKKTAKKKVVARKRK